MSSETEATSLSEYQKIICFKVLTSWSLFILSFICSMWIFYLMDDKISRNIYFFVSIFGFVCIIIFCNYRIQPRRFLSMDNREFNSNNNNDRNLLNYIYLMHVCAGNFLSFFCHFYSLPVLINTVVCHSDMLTINDILNAITFIITLLIMFPIYMIQLMEFLYHYLYLKGYHIYDVPLMSLNIEANLDTKESKISQLTNETYTSYQNDIRT